MYNRSTDLRLNHSNESYYERWRVGRAQEEVLTELLLGKKMEKLNWKL
jgi:hypothetical protein